MRDCLLRSTREECLCDDFCKQILYSLLCARLSPLWLQQTALTSSFPRLFHAVLVYVQRKQHVRVPVLFFGGVGALAAVASCDGCVQKPGGLLRGRSSQLRLVLELQRREKRRKPAEAAGCCQCGGDNNGQTAEQERGNHSI